MLAGLVTFDRAGTTDIVEAAGPAPDQRVLLTVAGATHTLHPAEGEDLSFPGAEASRRRTL